MNNFFDFILTRKKKMNFFALNFKTNLLFHFIFDLFVDALIMILETSRKKKEERTRKGRKKNLSNFIAIVSSIICTVLNNYE